MPKSYDTRLIMMVAQESFEDKLNRFCKLIPIIYVDGTSASPDDFPNDGEIWWMLTARTAQLAEPGRLVVGTVEDAMRYDAHDLTSSRYQAQRESVRDLEIRDGMEVLELPGDAIDDIQDLVSRGYRHDVPHRPTGLVMLRWRSQVYGPFLASPDAHGGAEVSRAFSFAPANVDMKVYQVGREVFESMTKEYSCHCSNNVSPTPQRRSESYQLTTARHELLLARGYERLLAANPKKLVLEPIDRRLLRFAKQCLTRAKRQELKRLLDEVEVTGRETQEAEELVQAVGRIRQVSDEQDVAINAVAKALLESGVLGEDRIRKAEAGYAEQYVRDRTAALQAQVEESVATRREELRRAEADLRDVQSRLQKEETQRRTILEQELEEERINATKVIAIEREEFEKQRGELERQQGLLQKNLEKVTTDLREAGDEVVNRFLAIAPLLGSIGLVNQDGWHREVPPRSGKVTTTPASFAIPAFITQTPRAPDEDLLEEAFFQRFAQFVEDSGFTYRALDLKRFHVSVKCEELTVLAGPSGTGKSSLPSLYGQALLGDESESGRPACLMVNINPAWMDVRDLIGHMNTLEGRFYPAESGLFQHLLYAQEEFGSRGASTGMYLTCLDEMNLSQVEYYFSDFMMVLERKGSRRTIQFFSPEIAGESCPFRKWGSIDLSPAVRFVGTVNFDETTRQLSDRFLDRVNLICLTSGSLPASAGRSGGGIAKACGRMVTLADFERWRAERALPPDLGALLDSIRPVLAQLGCPLSPRVYRGICRFVSSSEPLLTARMGFDVQLAQRVATKVRSLVTREQIGALDTLLRLLKESSVCSFDETVPLLQKAQTSAAVRGWDLED